MSPTEATPKKAAAKKAAPKKATKAKAKADEPEAAEAAAADPETGAGVEEAAPVDEELSAQDELDLKRLDIALVTLDDESLRRGLAGINEKQRQELATHLTLPKAPG